jgi:hypothetical protein
MKWLLDENLPVKLKYRFREAGWDVFTVNEMGWLSLENGHLLSAMLEAEFTGLITGDKNLPYQQNLEKAGIQIVVFSKARNNRYEVILPFVSLAVGAIEKNPNEMLYLIG